jgi:hypothetical protein
MFIMLARFYRCVDEAFRRYKLPLSFGYNAASVFRFGLEVREFSLKIPSTLRKPTRCKNQEQN